MQRAPLQTYASALVFSPYESQIRKENLAHYPTWFKYGPVVEDHWGPVLQTLQGHHTRVAALAFSFDGKYLASLSILGELLLWDAMTGTLHSTLIEAPKPFIDSASISRFRLAFSCNGQLASVSPAHEVRVWEPVTGVTCRTLMHKKHWEIVAIAFASDGTLAVSYDGFPRQTWIYKAGALPILVETEKEAYALSFLSEGSLALFCSDPIYLLTRADEIVLHDLKTRAERRIPTPKARKISFSSNNQLALSVQSRSVRLYDLRTESYQVLECGPTNVTALALSSKNRGLFVGSDDGSVQLWDLESGIRTVIWTCPGRNQILWIAPAPDGRLAIASEFAEEIRILEVRSDSMPSRGDQPNGSKQWCPALSSASQIVFSSDGKRLVYASDKGIHILDSATERELRFHQRLDVNSITIGDKYLASGGFTGAVHVWNLPSGELLKKLEGNLDYVAAVAFSPNNKVLLAADSLGRKADVWHTRTWSLQHTLKPQPPGKDPFAFFHSTAFSQNGKRIAFLYSDSSSIWDAEKCCCLQNIDIKFPRNASWRNQISVFAEDSYIDTTFGRVYLDQPPDGNGWWKVEDARWRVYRDWLYRDGQRLLLLPLDFQPWCTAIYDDLFVMGHESGNLTFFEGKDNDSAPEPGYQTTAPANRSKGKSRALEYFHHWGRGAGKDKA